MMNEEWKKMLRGEPYHALDPELLSMLFKTARETCIKRILGHCGVQPMVNSPFYCDFGCNIHVGDHFFSNFNLTILDEARVIIGNHVLIGPNVSLFTACHPTDPVERRVGTEWAKPITIGDDVWIGGNVTILPGVTIGAGSVVTKDIPDDSIAVGNPCRVIKKLPLQNENYCD